jgi:hypothetical protein
MCAPAPVYLLPAVHGVDQTVSGYRYYNSVAAKVVNDHEVDMTMKKDGKVGLPRSR